MTKNKDIENFCRVCKNQGTDICRVCTYRVAPSGNISQPSFWVYCALFDLLGDKQPPIGIKPRIVHDEERANNLAEAIVRYLNEGLPIPSEWVGEYNELRAKTQDAKSR